MNNTVQWIPTKMYYVLYTKVLQGSDTASGTVLQKGYSKICSLNLRLIYLRIVSKNSILKLNFLKETLYFSGCRLFLNKWNNESVVKGEGVIGVETIAMFLFFQHH